MMTNKIILGIVAALLLSASALVALAQDGNDLGKVFERQIEGQMVLSTGKWDRLDTLGPIVNEEAKSDPLVLHLPNR